MSVTVNGKEIKTKLLEELIDTIEKNNKLTNEQNFKLVKYTRWLFILTIIISLATIVQIIIILFTSVIG